MPSSATANLLDDGVADTLGLVDAMSGVHTYVCIDASDRAQIAAARMNGTKQRRGTLPVNLYKIFHMNRSDKTVPQLFPPTRLPAKANTL